MIVKILIPCVLTFVFLSYHSVAEAKKYKVHVKTGDVKYAGTGEDVEVILHGTKETVRHRFVGIGPRFERNRRDKLEFDGANIGSIIDIEVMIVDRFFYFDSWHLEWVKVFVDGDEYQGYFNYLFNDDKETHKSRRFQINRCRKGYAQMAFGNSITCQDRNECDTACKGDGEICENTDTGFICKCKPGFKTEGAGCIDYNECAESTHNPCAFSNAYCKNLPGSYECKCNSGYFGDYHSCQDQDECSLNVHECSQKCKNIPGTYKCECNQGFKLAVDLKTCVDVDECSASVNPCDSKTSSCYDEHGSYRCMCKAGFKPHATQPNICVARECNAISGLDKNVILTPERCMLGKNLYGEECTVSCKQGYFLDPLSAKVLRCENGPLNGFERVGGALPRCKPKLCPAITAPANAYTVPSKCATLGTTQDADCYIFCDNGFIMAGNRKYHCSNQKYDHDSASALCVRVPHIDCPSDVNINLPATQDKIAIKNAFPNFKTNMRMDQISANIAGVGPMYEFGVGTTIVVYKATNELNQTDTCSFAVRVHDLALPTIEYCPDDQYLVSKGGVQVNVTWSEPRFKDNVGVAKVVQSGKSGRLHSPTTFSVQYWAQDAALNNVACTFKVNFKVLTCSFDSIGGGDQLINKQCARMGGSQAICMAACADGKTFDIINSKAYVKYMWNCNKADFGIERMPDCVDFIVKKNKTCPAGYIETQDYRVFNNEEFVCGKCPRGTFFLNGNCSDCPRNTYQDQEGAQTCKKCPANKGTFTTRNILDSSCKALCLPGYISRSGIEAGSAKCSLCPVNSYSSQYGSTTCTKCPNGTATEGPGRSSIDGCLFAPRNVSMVPSGTIETSVGDSVQFDCYAQGNPLPFLHITKTISKANPQTHFLVSAGKMEPGTKGLRYLITKVSTYDAGSYICIAENKKGIVYRQIQLVVSEGSGMGSNDSF